MQLFLRDSSAMRRNPSSFPFARTHQHQVVLKMRRRAYFFFSLLSVLFWLLDIWLDVDFPSSTVYLDTRMRSWRYDLMLVKTFENTYHWKQVLPRVEYGFTSILQDSLVDHVDRDLFESTKIIHVWDHSLKLIVRRESFERSPNLPRSVFPNSVQTWKY